MDPAECKRATGSSVSQADYDRLKPSGSIGYLKALQILIQDGSSMEKAQKTVCWNRLTRLHEAMPNQYLNPEHLFLQMLADTAAINPSKRKSR